MFIWALRPSYARSAFRSVGSPSVPPPGAAMTKTLGVVVLSRRAVPSRGAICCRMAKRLR
ncbi:Uncharacterised protein [Mycobacteroides abscessus subsp. abscessus]|nr:Uncharacterised protein [Mycobacteroides abscessus subsp. abscessus]